MAKPEPYGFSTPDLAGRKRPEKISFGMKTALKWALLGLLLLAGGTIQAQVRFESGSTDALHEKALKLGKPVFIDLYADWCQPCRWMEQRVFAQKEVGDFINSRFVAARYDVDQTTGQALMKRYGSGSIPLLLVFSPQGELLGRITGASSAERLLKDLQRILDGNPESRPENKPRK